MNIKHGIILSGTNTISLDQDNQTIIDEMNKNLKRFYGDLVKVVSVNQIDMDTVEIVINRDLPASHIQNNLLDYIDEAIISGMDESSFLPFGPKPVIFPILPLGDSCFSPNDEFYELYKHLINICTGEKVTRITIVPTTSDINIVVEYKSRIPRRYKQDIMNLTAKYGDLNNLSGQTISSTLRDFSSICQRDSPKVASYNGLAKFLGKEYNITLDIKSQKSK